MAALPTSTASGSGTQAATQSPQTAASTPTGSPASGVQPGSNASMLENQAGEKIPLSSSEVTMVDLGQTNTLSTAAVSPATTVAREAMNPALLGIPLILFLVAIVLFFSMSRLAKNTTN